MATPVSYCKSVSLGFSRKLKPKETTCQTQCGYRLGKTVQRLICIPVALIDVILQIFQMIAHTFEFLICKVESLATRKSFSDTFIGRNIRERRSLSSMFQSTRNRFTILQRSHLSYDLTSEDDRLGLTYSKSYRNFLHDLLRTGLCE